MTVELNGEEVEAMIYIMNGNRPIETPSVSYYDTIEQGYKENGLDLKYLETALANAIQSEILEAEENGSKYVRLVHVVEIKEGDTSYVDQMDASIRWNLKGEDFEKEISDYAKGLTVVKHEYAMSAFKVKKINYGEQ